MPYEEPTTPAQPEQPKEITYGEKIFILNALIDRNLDTAAELDEAGEYKRAEHLRQNIAVLEAVIRDVDLLHRVKEAAKVLREVIP